jgi:hypothetical protein
MLLFSTNETEFFLIVKSGINIELDGILFFFYSYSLGCFTKLQIEFEPLLLKFLLMKSISKISDFIV